MEKFAIPVDLVIELVLTAFNSVPEIVNILLYIIATATMRLLSDRDLHSLFNFSSKLILDGFWN